MFKATFVPQQHNSYRPHAIRWYGLAVGLFLTISLQVVQNYQVASSPQVLAYATNTTVSGLLTETNANRSSNGLQGLALSSTLNNAAQAKAQDMINDNYWAHVAPDGTTPWDFINATGYTYLKAGENLAYGYATSSATVTGWMNSPSHRDNILDVDYEQVGFGIANGANFQGGENTVVVAMYADPVGASYTPPVTVGSSLGSSAPLAGSGPTSLQLAPTTPVSTETEPEPINLSPATINYELTSTRVTNFEALIDGQAHWTLYGTVAILGLMSLVYFYRHVIFVHNLVIKGEHVMQAHPLLEASAIYLALWFILSATFGVNL